MTRTEISKNPSGRIIVSFPYAPLLVSKVKTTEGRRWHFAQKHWHFLKPHSSPFEGEAKDSFRSRYNIRKKNESAKD